MQQADLLAFADASAPNLYRLCPKVRNADQSRAP